MRQTVTILIGALACIAIVLLLLFYWFDFLLERRQDVYVSFWASLSEDLIFFGLIGIAILVYQARKPDRDSLDKRIQYLYGGVQLSERALDHTKSRLKEIAGYYEKAAATLTVVEYDPHIQAYRVIVRRKMSILNLFRDAAYEENIQVGVEVDKFDSPNFLNGEITEINLTVQGLPPVPLLKATEKIFNEGFNAELQIHVPPGSRASYDVCYWMWMKQQEPYSINAVRFMQDVTINVENNLPRSLSITLDDAGGQISILQAQRLTVNQREAMLPKDKMSITLLGYQPEGGQSSE